MEQRTQARKELEAYQAVDVVTGKTVWETSRPDATGSFGTRSSGEMMASIG